MGRRVATLFALAAATVALVPDPAQAAPPFAPCASGAEVECATIQVPLDRTGVVSGAVSLHVERLAGSGLVRGAMLMLAGGPGQPGANTFALADHAREFRSLFPGYTLVTYDVRGTGRSSPLSCPQLQASLSSFSTDPEQFAALFGACGLLIGDSRRFYSTRDHAEDIEAIRQALGVDRIAIWGTSYGTQHAMAYTLAHPEHVARLLLDSSVSPEGRDPLTTDTLRALPAALSSL